MTDYAKLLDRLKSEGNFRTVPEGTAPDILDFSTNDYLGLALRTDLRAAFFADPERSGASLTSSASRLLAADQLHYTRFENYLRDRYGREALIFNSGYHANTGMLQALASEGDTLIVADKLVHASMIDGITLSKAPMRRFRHNDMTHLERILVAEAKNHARVLIAVESVYSMDGDSAPLSDIIHLKRLVPNAILYVDEAHGLGVCGPRGLGLCEALPADERREVDVMIGTLGKACASAGAFAILSDQLRHVAVNRARSFIFSTALPPLSCEWSMWMMENMERMDAERRHIAALAERLHDGLEALAPGRTGTASHIQPLIIGSAGRTVSLSKRLLKRGVKVLPIRTPTVPPGTERLRISVSAACTEADIDTLLHALAHEL